MAGHLPTTAWLTIASDSFFQNSTAFTTYDQIQAVALPVYPVVFTPEAQGQLEALYDGGQDFETALNLPDTGTAG